MGQLTPVERKDMLMAIRITCITKSNGHHLDPHHAIQNLGWTNEETGKTGKNTRVEIYTWLKNEHGKAYVKDRFGDKADLYPRENAAGTKFVQTRADGIWLDNLLALPECSWEWATMTWKVKTLHPPKPPKPLDRLQNMMTLQPLGKTKWGKAHWRWNYDTHQWEWVLGHWSK
jgi:hypothetical protein